VWCAAPGNAAQKLISIPDEEHNRDCSLHLPSQREGSAKHRPINELKKQLHVMQSASHAVAKDNASKWN